MAERYFKLGIFKWTFHSNKMLALSLGLVITKEGAVLFGCIGPVGMFLEIGKPRY